MAAENELKPLDISQVKASTSRIDLQKATIPASPSGGIRIGTNPKKATSHIDISALPGAKAQTSRVGLGAMPVVDDDVYKRRTALLDTSNIPISAAPHAAATGGAQPRTIRIGSRPTVRVGGAPATTFTPGRSAESEASAVATTGAGRPTIKLKRPGGGSSIAIGGGESSAPSAPMFQQPDFSIQEDEGPGAVWTVLSLLSLLVTLGLVAVQVITLKGMAY